MLYDHGMSANDREGVYSFNNKGLKVIFHAIKTELILNKLSFITKHSRSLTEITERLYQVSV